MKYKKILTIAFLILVSFYFFQLWRVAHNYSQSYRFGDEDAHMAGGYLILQGLKPYNGFAVNHQPLIYYFSAAVQKIFHPNTLFLFIGRHREAIFAYSIFWNILYLIIFGPIIFFFTAIFEIMRYVMLGNKVLGESLAVYPLAMLFGLAIKRLIFDKRLLTPEIIISSLSSFIAAFTLLPIWPAIFILNLMIFIANRKNRKELILQVASLIIPTIILFLFVPLKDYFRETFYYNYKYVIPNMNLDKYKFPESYIRMVLLPFAAIKNHPNFMEVAAAIFLFLYAVILYRLRHTKKIWPFLTIIFALVLTNNRVYEIKPGNFHLLPWLGAYFFIPIVFIAQSFHCSINKKAKITEVGEKRYQAFMLAILFALAIWLNFFSRSDYYGNILLNLHNNIESEHYINYADSVKYGLGIKAVMAPGDRLIGLPNDELVFWVAGANLATKPLENYDWQYNIPRYNKELYDVFANNPPEFYLATELNPLSAKSPLDYFILKNLDNKYVRVNHLGHTSNLYILKTKLPKITPDQWKTFKYLLFEKPTVTIFNQ